jgi:alpha,alpha-trehalase
MRPKPLRRPFPLVCAVFCCWLATSAQAQTVPVVDNLWRLEAQEDTDGDHQITIRDHLTPFQIRDETGAVVRTVTNEYQLSVLLQELKRAEDRHTNKIAMAHIQLDETIVDRTHRFIRDFFWDALTRRIDAHHFDQVVSDPKVPSKYDYIYVPGSDPVAVKYFLALEQSGPARHRSPALKVVILPAPEKFTAAFIRNLDGSHGILSLKLATNDQGEVTGGVPYVVPGGRFNELYEWDSYFIVQGLLQDGRVGLARDMADNLIYEMEHYGIIPNANRTYYLTRSQPPFLTSIIRAVYDDKAADRAWLAAALQVAMTEYQTVWLGRERLVTIGTNHLSRYYDRGNGPCPEVEAGHYDEKLAGWRAQVPPTDPPLTPFRFLNQYLYCDQYDDLRFEGLTLAQFFKHDRAVRESGHDTTHRFDDRTADFVSVDLNTLLYKYEKDFADLLQNEFGGTLPGQQGDFAQAAYWRRQAARRKQAMLTLMWDDRRGFFFDYDFARQQRSTYISATGLWPLWAGMLDPENPAERAMVQRMAAYSREKLEAFSGLAASAQESVAAARMHDARQWDYPYGWAPHQMLAWQGFRNYGLKADASRLAYRWLYTIAKNAHDFNGVIPEKYNVVTGSHEVFVEYGNVGTKFDYIPTEGFGWMNASFEVGMNFLSPEQLRSLRRLDPPPTGP